MADWRQCDCERRDWYDADAYSSCYECYQERRSHYVTCILCGRWHSPLFDVCFQCAKPGSGGRDDPAQSLRYLILWRDRNRCQECGDDRGLQVDHIVPCSSLGNAEEWNLQVLCGPCNRTKGGRWHAHCRYENTKTALVRRYYLIQSVYFAPEARKRFMVEVALWRATGTWDPLIHKHHRDDLQRAGMPSIEESASASLERRPGAVEIEDPPGWGDAA